MFYWLNIFICIIYLIFIFVVLILYILYTNTSMCLFVCVCVCVLDFSWLSLICIMFEKKKKKKNPSIHLTNNKQIYSQMITITIVFEALCLLVVGVLGIVKPCCASLQRCLWHSWWRGFHDGLLTSLIKRLMCTHRYGCYRGLFSMTAFPSDSEKQPDMIHQPGNSTWKTNQQQQM